jgi:hypothetical protein
MPRVTRRIEGILGSYGPRKHAGRPHPGASFRPVSGRSGVLPAPSRCVSDFPVVLPRRCDPAELVSAFFVTNGLPVRNIGRTAGQVHPTGTGTLRCVALCVSVAAESVMAGNPLRPRLRPCCPPPRERKRAAGGSRPGGHREPCSWTPAAVRGRARLGGGTVLSAHPRSPHLRGLREMVPRVGGHATYRRASLAPLA